MAAAVNTPTPEIGTTNQTEDGCDKKCIFCKIVKGEMGTELLHNVSVLSVLYYDIITHAEAKLQSTIHITIHVS